MTASAAPTLEYTCSVCTCGRELSTLYYLLTVREQFSELAQFINLPAKDIDNIGFTTLAAVEKSISFCCLMNLRYGIRVPLAVITKGDTSTKVSSYKYPEGLPGPLSREKTLTWL